MLMLMLTMMTMMTSSLVLLPLLTSLAVLDVLGRWGGVGRIPGGIVGGDEGAVGRCWFFWALEGEGSHTRAHALACRRAPRCPHTHHAVGQGVDRQAELEQRGSLQVTVYGEGWPVSVQQPVQDWRAACGHDP